jgi:hypothetical protein
MAVYVIQSNKQQLKTTIILSNILGEKSFLDAFAAENV